MKKLIPVVSIIIFLLLSGRVSAQSTTTGTLTIESDPAFVSLTSSINEATITFKNIDWGDKKITSINLKMNQINDSNSSSLVYLYSNQDDLIKAASAASSGIKKFMELERVIDTNDKSATFKLKSDSLQTNESLNYQNIFLEINYEVVDKQAPEISKITIEEVTRTSFLVTWKTNEGSLGKVQSLYGGSYMFFQTDRLKYPIERSTLL